MRKLMLFAGLFAALPAAAQQPVEHVFLAHLEILGELTDRRRPTGAWYAALPPSISSSAR